MLNAVCFTGVFFILLYFTRVQFYCKCKLLGRCGCKMYALIRIHTPKRNRKDNPVNAMKDEIYNSVVLCFLFN